MPEIYRRRFTPTDPRLNRHVNHDPRSRAYAVRVDEDAPIATVQHKRYLPIFNQGSIGACTSNAGNGCTGTGSFFASLGGAKGAPKYAWNEDGSLRMYARETQIDDYPGTFTYPPAGGQDTGSDGLTAAKVLVEAGEISGYTHAFTPASARAALMNDPEITGISWTEDMFNPDDTGRVKPTGSVAGGHEIVVAGYVMLKAAPSNDDQVWFDNSWDPSWGVVRPGQSTAGSFWMAFGDWSELLNDDGDVTQFVAITQPAPVPTPTPDADATLWAATKHWTTLNHVGTNATAAHAVKAWAKTKGLS